MENNIFSFPNMGKHVLRSTGEEVEIIAYNQPNNGMRTEPKDLTFEEGDWVTYIDSEGKEHIREHLNYQLDFKLVITDVWNTIAEMGKNSKIPTIRNNRIFDTAKELYINGDRGLGIKEIVEVATNLVDRVGIEFN